MKLTTKTARRLKELQEYVNTGDEYMANEIINFKNELKEIFFRERNYDDLSEALLTIIQEIESVENEWWWFFWFERESFCANRT